MSKKDNIIFSNNLKRLMAVHGKDQIDLINDLGINKSTISTWVRAEKMPRMGTIQLLANYFNVNISDLVDDKSTFNEGLILTEHEKEIILAYRNQPAMQEAVDKLLGVPADVDMDIIADDVVKTVKRVDAQVKKSRNPKFQK